MGLQPFGPWPLFQFLNLYRVGRTTWTGIRPSLGRYLHTEQTHTDIHASSGIRNHDPSTRAGEDGSCLRPFHSFLDHERLLFHCDWLARMTSVLRIRPADDSSTTAFNVDALTTDLRINYVSFYNFVWTEDRTVRVLDCSIRCHGNACLPKRCLALCYPATDIPLLLTA
jgi:hypothetical protein